MVLPGFFKKKSETRKKRKMLNKMWNLWAEGGVESPYAELMTYQSEVNNGGHDQYFFNVLNIGGDIQKEMTILETVLSAKMQNNLREAYEAYSVLTEKDSDEEAEAILKRCDEVFYESQEAIERLLEEYAAKI